MTITPAAGDAPVRLGPAAATRCRRRVHLDHAPDAPTDERGAPDDGAQMRITDSIDHQRSVLDRWADAPLGLTAEEIRQSRPELVVQPRLADPQRSGTPELLVRSGTGYLPVIVRGHKTLDIAAGRTEVSPVEQPGERQIAETVKRRRHGRDLLQLSHFHRQLQACGLAAGDDEAAVGGVVGKGEADAEWIVWLPLAESLPGYDENFADRQEVVAAARAGGDVTAPSRISECRQCPWWPVCAAELEAAHDISLLAAGADVAVLQEAGLRTLHDVLASPVGLVEGLQLTSLPPAEARLRALAKLEGTRLIRRSEQTAAPRADVELDVDMESFMDEGAYLWGTLLSGRGVEAIGAEPGYRAFVTFEPLHTGAAGSVFVEFWSYLTELRTACAAADLTFAAYCWARKAEERWLYGVPKRFPELPGMPAEPEVRSFCTSPQWVDLYEVVKSRFLVPGSMGLKAIAPQAGFQWRDSDPGGENSMVWYRAAVGSESAEPDLALRQRLLDYNEDDVQATFAVREWLEQGAALLPTVADLTERLAGWSTAAPGSSA